MSQDYCWLMDKRCEVNFLEHIENENRISEVFLISDSQINPDYWDWTRGVISKHLLTPTVATDVVTTGNLFCQKICSKIKNSFFTVVDLSTWRESANKIRPNIYMEVGISVANNKPTLFLTYEKPEEVLGEFSDFAGVTVCTLDGPKPPNNEELKKIKEQLKQKMKGTLSKEEEKILQGDVISDKNKSVINESIKAGIESAIAAFLINSSKDYSSHTKLRDGVAISYHQLLSLYRKISLINLEVKSLYQGVNERYFSNVLIKKIQKSRSSWNEEQQQDLNNVECFRKNFRELLRHCNYTDIMSISDLRDFSQSSPRIPYAADFSLVGKEENKEHIKTVFHYMKTLIKDFKKYKLYLTEDERGDFKDNGVLIAGDRAHLTCLRKRLTYKMDLPSAVGKLKLGVDENVLNSYQEICDSPKTIKNSDEVRGIIDGLIEDIV